MDIKCAVHNIYHEDARMGNIKLVHAYRLGIAQIVTRDGVRERCLKEILSDPRLVPSH